MLIYTCEHCQSTFTAKSNLYRHQSRAQYCLQTRGLETSIYTCVCGKKFSRKDALQRHKDKYNCKEDETTETSSVVLKVVDDYKDMIKDLQKHIVELSSRPTKVTNNTNVLNNLQPITDEDLQENLDNLKLDFILEGAKGYANFAKWYPLRDNIVCTDRARKKIKYKNEHGEITDDARLLTKRFFQAISERNKDILNAAYKDTHEEVKEIVANGTAGDSDITSLLTRAIDLQNILIRSQKAASGEDEEFTQEFINHLAKII